MQRAAPAPRLLVTAIVTPLLAGVLALYWYTDWIVLQGYPPLRIASFGVGVVGLVAAAGAIWVRRARPATPPAARSRAAAAAAARPAVAAEPP
ncbi:MAG: hypothetical protein H6708_19215 [Kofleriaceae bacterium]|nr:hypothetical protein [Kofleriaceae bacterium]